MSGWAVIPVIASGCEQGHILTVFEAHFGL